MRLNPMKSFIPLCRISRINIRYIFQCLIQKKFSERQTYLPSRIPPISEDTSLHLLTNSMVHVTNSYESLCNVQQRSFGTWPSFPKKNLNVLTNCRNSQYFSLGPSMSLHYLAVYFRLKNCQNILKMTH